MLCQMISISFGLFLVKPGRFASFLGAALDATSPYSYLSLSLYALFQLEEELETPRIRGSVLEEGQARHFAQ